MSEFVTPLAEMCAATIEAIGVVVIAAGAVYALVNAMVSSWRGTDVDVVYRNLRQSLGRSILLGLEFLVAADIIHTVAVELNFNTVGVLAIVVLIRTFLSFTLELELTGKWPWQERPAEAGADDADA